MEGEDTTYAYNIMPVSELRVGSKRYGTKERTKDTVSNPSQRGVFTTSS